MATLQPSTNCEVQLYHVLHRANLLQYFDTFITQGGDDVQQLCEAGEEEFLEIMALVGMASKPLHVRRLQKVLQEWVANPTAFDGPKTRPTVVMSMVGSGVTPVSTPSPLSSTESSHSPAISMPSSHGDPFQQANFMRNKMNDVKVSTITCSGSNSVPSSCTSNSTVSFAPTQSSLSYVGASQQHFNTTKDARNYLSSHEKSSINPQVDKNAASLSVSTTSSSPSGNTASVSTIILTPSSFRSDQSPPWALQTRGPSPPNSMSSRRNKAGVNESMTLPIIEPATHHASPPDSPIEFKDVIKNGVYNPDEDAYLPTHQHPVLMDHQITAIAAAAAILARDLPTLEPKTLQKNQNSQYIQRIMMMSADDPDRIDALRKYAAIYGRFDSRRKNHRPMSLHEISVNEAAAQLCNHIPALLTRREELFPMARQVVRDSGYQYSKGHSRASEVLIHPKVESKDQDSNSVSVVQSTPQVDGMRSFENEEMNNITFSLSEIIKEQARIRDALRVLLEANDLEQVRGLTAEMDVLNDRQERLLKRRQKLLTKYKKAGKMTGCVNVPPKTKFGNKKNPCNMSTTTNNDNTDNKNNVTRFTGMNAVTTSTYPHSSTLSNNNPGTNNLSEFYSATALQNHKDSLFEEGLRIAEQYGMSDFADELIGMKSQKGGSNAQISTVPTHGLVLGPSQLKPSSCLGTPSSLFMSSIISPSSSASSLSSPLPASAASVDNISASSKEYLAPASGCKLHLPSTSSSLSSTSPPSSSSLLFPSVIVPPSQDNLSKIHNESLPPTSVVPSINYTNPASVISSNLSILETSNTDLTNQNVTVDLASSPTPCETSAPSSQQGSTTVTTTITTRSGEMIEVETRRSSRRKNGEPDYYLINGGEKRFRASAGSSTCSSTNGSNNVSYNVSPSKRIKSDKRKSTLPEDDVPSISSPSQYQALDPCKTINNDSEEGDRSAMNVNNDSGEVDRSSMKVNLSNMSFTNPSGEIHKVRLGFQQRI